MDCPQVLNTKHYKYYFMIYDNYYNFLCTQNPNKPFATEDILTYNLLWKLLGLSKVAENDVAWKELNIIRKAHCLIESVDFFKFIIFTAYIDIRWRCRSLFNQSIVRNQNKTEQDKTKQKLHLKLWLDRRVIWYRDKTSVFYDENFTKQKVDRF